MKRKGFTLVELSIVLVIIGLLIGGILVAQSMISTARVHKVVSRISQYEIATNLFITNYNQIPGDSTFFTPAGNNNNQSDDLITCAGGWEGMNSFAHMYQAGMLKDSYTAYCSMPAPRSWLYTDRFGGVSYPLISNTPIYYGDEAIGTNSYVRMIKPANETAINLTFSLASSELIPVETKLGGHKPQADAAASGGLRNNGDAAGKCYEPAGNVYVDCVDYMDLSFGSVSYYIMPAR